MMSKRNLYPTVNGPERRLSDIESNSQEVNEDGVEERDYTQDLMRVLGYSDGDHSITWIANRYGTRVEELSNVIDQLCNSSLLKPIEYTPDYNSPYDPPMNT